MPVVASSLKHIKPAFFDDQLYIQIILERLPKASLEFSYEVLNQNKDIICRGYTKLAFLKSNSQKPIRCPDFIYNLFDK